MEVKTSSSIPVFKASVCWNAFIVMKMRSGVGRFVVLVSPWSAPPFAIFVRSNIHPARPLVPTSIPLPRIRAGLAYFLSPHGVRGALMKREYHRWHSPRLGLDLGVIVHGHWGQPILGFPTSAGDESELEGQSMIGALADFIEGGKIKVFSINSINGLSFYNKGAHPFHRSYVQSVFDSYLREEVVPFIWDNCQSPGSPFPPWARRSARITPPTRSSSIPT